MGGKPIRLIGPTEANQCRWAIPQYTFFLIQSQYARRLLTETGKPPPLPLPLSLLLLGLPPGPVRPRAPAKATPGRRTGAASGPRTGPKTGAAAIPAAAARGTPIVAIPPAVNPVLMPAEMRDRVVSACPAVLSKLTPTKKASVPLKVTCTTRRATKTVATVSARIRSRIVMLPMLLPDPERTCSVEGCCWRCRCPCGRFGCFGKIWWRNGTSGPTPDLIYTRSSWDDYSLHPTYWWPFFPYLGVRSTTKAHHDGLPPQDLPRKSPIKASSATKKKTIVPVLNGGVLPMAPLTHRSSQSTAL